LDENTDLGLRGETILTLCSIVAALTNTQEEELAKSLIKETLEGLAMSLKLPIIIYGRTAAEQMLNQFEDKSPLMINPTTLFIGIVFSPLAAIAAYLITYSEYQHHYSDNKKPKKLAMETALGTLLLFLLISLTIGWFMDGIVK